MISDLLVIDASSVLAGPSVATYFGELGARVIKIEHPVHKDVTRSWKLKTEDSKSPVSAYFSSINYNKEYRSIDLKDEDGRMEFLALIKNADILITNFKKGDDVKFGIEDHVLHGINPRLIIGKINGYGQDSDRVAYDLILQAESGLMSMNGTQESGPVKVPIALIDVFAGHQLREGILLALFEREHTGEGKSISVSLYDAALSGLVNQASNYLMAGHIPERIGSLHPNIAPYGELFQTLDGSTITFAIGSDTHFRKMCEYLCCEELINNPKYSSNQNRVSNRLELYEVLQEKVILHNSIDLIDDMINLNVPAGKVKSLDEVFADDEALELVREETIEGVLTKRVTSNVCK